MNRWSDWKQFPDPRKGDYLYAPFGPGVYELLSDKTGEFILYGSGGNVAFRMSSLLPEPHGCGTRKNIEKRKYVLENIESVKYRTVACSSIEDAKREENKLRRNKIKYRFQS